jgi:hypothetical protein
MLPLFQADFKEMVTEDEPLDPDWALFGRYEMAGLLKLYTVRAAGVVVGYNLFTLGPSLLQKTVFRANCVALWLHPAYRAGRVGIRLIKGAEEGLRADGVQKVRYGVHLNYMGGAVVRMVERFGYVPYETVCEKGI